MMTLTAYFQTRKQS